MLQPEAPLVSIVTPSLNQARFLDQTILSVIRQSYPRIEYIVIDGGSADGSLEIIQRHADSIAYWTSQPDTGQAEAINKGLSLATGEIVAWLNSDDLYLANTIPQAVEAFRAYPDAAMVYGDGLMIDEGGRLLDRHRYRSLETLDLLCFNVLLQPTVFMRRSILEIVGRLDTSYHMVLDHDLWVRLSARHRIVHVPAYWAVERTHPGAKTIAQPAHFVEEAQRLISRAELSEDLGPLVNAHRAAVHAGLELFAARRLIDAGEYGQALARFRRAARLYPAGTLRVWYKIAQALLGGMGLERAFVAYRNARRRIQSGNSRVVIGPAGAELKQADALVGGPLP